MPLVNLQKIPEKLIEGTDTSVKASLNAEETKLLLQNVPAAYKTQINDILLTALLLSYGDLTGEYSLYLNLEGHGREYVTEDIDLSRTVGWFTTIFPVFLNLKNTDSLSMAIKAVKEQLRQIPANGIGFGILYFLSKEKNLLNANHDPEIIFNYLGQMDSGVKTNQLLKNAPESYGQCSHSKNRRSYPIEISAQIKNGIFEISWSFSLDNYESETLKAFAERYISRLKSLIEHCTNSENFGYVPSDFPLAKLNQQTLDKVFGHINKIEDIYPLSPLQSGLLFNALAHIKSDTYLVQTLYTFKGQVSEKILQLACKTINEHYTAFRTGFIWEGLDTPLQFIQKESPLIWEFKDWSHLSQEAQDLSLKQLLDDDRKVKFDFRHPPLSRWYFIKISALKSYLLWTHHHILLDGWSGPIILSQMMRAYQQLSHNQQPHLLYSPSYKAYIHYLEDHSNVDEEFWTTYLNNMSSQNYLSNKLSLKERADTEHDYYEFNFSPEETNNIKECAKNLQISLNTLIQGAWAILLSLYTQNEDVVFGVTVSGRNIDLEGIEDTVGLFINTLPLRTQVKKAQNLKDFLAALQLNMAQVNNMAQTSLARIKSYAKNENHQELFNTLLVFENFPTDQKFAYVPTDFQLEKIEAFEKTEYPLSFIVNVAEKLSCNMNFETTSFDKEGVVQLAEYFINILDKMQTSTHAKVQDLMELKQEDKVKILRDWNNTTVAYPNDKTLHELFEEQVEKSPRATAVVFKDHALTYEELNQKANQLAHYLQNLGSGPETLVAISLDRSLEMIVGLLGILKSGGAYVPLDPSYPEERLRFMLEDTKAPVLITQAHLAPKFTFYAGQQILLDQSPEKLLQEKNTNLACLSSVHNLAYVIYTSGSTGLPKGACNLHKGIVNRLTWMQTQYRLAPRDNVLHKTSFSFDVSVWEFFWPLIAGAKLTIAPPEAHRNPTELVDLVKTECITVMHFVPSMLGMFLDTQGVEQCHSLRLVIASGEALSLNLQIKFFEKLGSELHNLYGPTEAAIDVTYWKCQPTTTLPFVPIGKPIANTEMYILDRDLEPLPIGIAGELHIGGIGLARGYLNRPDLTAEKFIKHPFNQDPHARLYKTGDLARYLADGNIEFLGRIDHQVKIRGYRIELGEIEENLAKHENVKSCVVIAKSDKEEHVNLVAYIVLHKEPTQTGHMEEKAANELREYLSKTLPDYMVPSYFLTLERLPLNANGKLDRAQLPEPDSTLRSRTHSYVSPTTKMEKMLADIWCRILSVENISINDNFFYLGGDSIIAIRLVSQAKQVGLHFDIKQVFQFPTIHQLANSIEATPHTGTNLTVVPQKSKILPLTPIQKWFFENVEFIHHYNQSALLDLRREISFNDLKVFGEQLLKCYDTLRLTFSKSKEGWTQKIQDIHYFTSIDYCTEKTLRTDNNKALNDCLQEECKLAQSSLNIETGPLFKLVLINIEAEAKQKLFVVFHHLVIDGISWRIFFDLLQTLVENRSQSLEEKHQPPSYATWLWQLNQYANGKEIENQLAYWHLALSNDSVSSSNNLLKCNNTEVTSSFSDQKHYTTHLTTQKTDLLLHAAHYAYKTQINDLLLTALAQAFGEINNHDLLTLSIEGHGREDCIDCQGSFDMFGWFTTIFPITLSLKTPDDLGGSIKFIKEKLRAIPYNGIGYGILKYLTKNLGKLHEELKSYKEPKIIFNYLGQLDESSNAKKPFTIISTPDNYDIDERNKLSFDLVINCMVRNQTFEVNFSYNSKCYEHHVIQKLAQTFIKKLTALIDHCIEPSHYGYTPSDFSLSHLTQEQIDQVFGKTKNIQGVYPLSPMQAAFAFMSFSQKTQEANFIQSVYEIKGDLNEEALKYSWQELFQQSEILRTGFCCDSKLDQPLQYVSTDLPLPWFVHDFQNHSEQDHPQKLAQLLKEDVSKGFKLDHPPLVRLKLVKCSYHLHYLIVSYHHIIMDGWCMPIFISELQKKYSSIIESPHTYEASIFPTPYRNYINWLAKQDEKKAEEFWSKDLKGFLSPSYLALGSQHDQTSTYHYDELKFYLTPQETDRIELFAKKCHVTLNTLTQVGWGLLLHHYTKKSDIIFGVTVSGRAIDLPGVETMLGLCINTVPLRIQILEDEDLQTLLTRTQSHMSAIQEYSYLPLAKIRSLSELQGGLPLFNTIFVFENYPKINASGESLPMSLISVMSKGEYPLGITIVPEDALLFKFDYCTDDFNPNIVENLAKNLKEILLSLADDTEEEQNDK